MNRVHTVNEKPVEEMGVAALSIGISGTNQRHVGVLHRGGNPPQVRFLHLEDDRVLTNEPILHGYLWVNPNIHPRRLPQVAAICRLVWKVNANGGIPFGFGPPNDCFDEETSEYLLGPTHLGLTCATFVLAVFHRAGLQLVDYDSWPVGRIEDKEWQDKIVRYLERKIPDIDRIPKLRDVVGKATRYRPEEVAGAATISPRPAEFDAAAARASLVLAKLELGSDAPKLPSQ